MMAALLGLYLLALPAFAQQPSSISPTATIPIRKVMLPSGGRYFALPVQVGSNKLYAAIDTGSAGLRVLAPALGPNDFQPGGKEARLEFISGTILSGPRSTVNVGFGAVHGPVTIQVIDKVSCDSKDPQCAEGNMPLDQLGMMGGGKPGQGAPAILGASIVPEPVGVPFPELGIQRWIFDIPNDLGGGRLTLNPPQNTLQGFVRMPYVRGPGLPKDGVRGCLQNDRTGRKICGIILFDTGAPGMSVNSPDPLPASWKDGTPASLLYQSEDGATLLIQSFRVGDPRHNTRLRFTTNPEKKNTIIHANASPFFCFDVMYEADREALSLRPRRSGPQDPQAQAVAR